MIHAVPLPAQAFMPGPCPDSWTKIGNTALAPNAVTFTALTGNKNGAAWNPVQIDLHSPFDMSCSLLVQVDGVAFVLQSEGLTAIGGWGAGQGYGNVYGTTPGTPVSPSVDFEVDTFDNYGPDVNDPSYDHLSVKLNGVMSVYAAGPVYAIPGQSDISDGNVHTFRVTWDPTTFLFNIYFDGSLRLTYTADIINQVFAGNSMVYWGFTGSSANYNQYIILPCGTSSTPTPSPTSTGTYTLSNTPTVTDTFTPSNTPTPSLTSTPTYSLTATATSTDTPTSTSTPTVTSTPTATPDRSFHLWPNPFNPNQAVRGTLKASYIPEGGRLSIYTLSGEKVIVLQATSANRIDWDGTTSKGIPVSPGIYYYQLLVQEKCVAKNALIIQ
jgi:hypothetical protein